MKIIEFTPLGDSRGSLVALEANKSIPFDIKRVYYIFATNMGVSRGYHAHRNLKQVAVCVTGSCRFIWREMHDFTPDCVLMVLASDYYDEDDYIRDYHKFVKEAREQH